MRAARTRHSPPPSSCPTAPSPYPLPQGEGEAALTHSKRIHAILPPMDPTDIGLFRLAEKRLNWVDQRQHLLAQNVANANTPGFEAKDVTPFTSRLSAALGATDPAHFGGALPTPSLAHTRPHERAPDGNAASVEDQLSKIADTAGTQALVTNLYRKYAGLFRTALGRTG